VRGGHSTLMVAALLALLSGPALADSKLLATSGGQQIEGQAGGGIVPWGIISGYGDDGEVGGGLALSRVTVDDFDLGVAGLSVGVNNRFEAGVARQRLAVNPLNLRLEQDAIGAKLRLGGDLLYGAMPSITAGVQHKRHRDGTVPRALGAQADSGTDYLVSAARLWLNAVAGRNVFANLTLRSTEAHQTGLLGFGDDRRWVAEGAAGIFLNRHWILGAEYRQKPDRLPGLREDDWWDLFIGWFPSKRLSLVAAYTDLGSIAGLPDQTGVYLSLQVTR